MVDRIRFQTRDHPLSRRRTNLLGRSTKANKSYEQRVGLLYYYERTLKTLVSRASDRIWGPRQGRRAAETLGPSTLVLSPTKKCVRQISVIEFVMFH